MNVSLVGMPNVGKTALFNALTGSFQKVANFPGVTVEKKIATISYSTGEKINLVDLPGLYSMDIATLDEKVTRDWLKKENAPIVLVLDATHLQKSFYILMQILELGHRPIIALTQMDQSNRRGQKLDVERLKELTQCAVIAVSATTEEGIDELKNEIKKFSQHTPVDLPPLPERYESKIKEPQYVKEKFQAIDSWFNQIVINPLAPDTITQKLDRFTLHPVGGFITLFLILFFIFQALFSWASPFQDLIDAGISALAQFVSGLITHELLKSFVVDGMITGVGSIIIFLPQILLMFLFIQVLEDVGYLGRAAFLLDGFMRKLGLPGKAVIPLLSSHACAIPGVLATRILEDRRERIISMLVIPLTTCSARLPVFTLLVAAIIPSESYWGYFKLQGIVMMALYIFPMISAILVAAVLRKVLPHSAPSMLLMELPPYRLPKASHVLKSLQNKAMIFLSNAGKVILLFSMIIWLLVSFPRQNDGSPVQMDKTYAAQIGKVFTPVFEPIGFDWRMNTALIPAFGAREVLVAALGTVFAVEGDEETQISGLTKVLSEEYSLASLMALIVWFVFAPQCMSTVAVIKRESGGWSTPIIMVVYTLVLAWVMAFFTYRLFI
jgi:ferrous iron transport protein B